MKGETDIVHPIHPHHKLTLEYTETPFNCDGCKEAGIGLKYKCFHCDFHLHKTCALAPLTTTHTFFNKCNFRLHHRPPGQGTRVCDACQDDVAGFVYHCTRCGYDLHPCCATLPRVLDDGTQDLLLCTRMAKPCHRCGNKGPGWSYRSACKGYNLHVSCVKELLVESWQAVSLKVDTDRVRDMHTRIPNLRNTTTRKAQRGNKKKKKKCCDMAKGAVAVIVSAILGDPITAIIAAIVGVFVSK